MEKVEKKREKRKKKKVLEDKEWVEDNRSNENKNKKTQLVGGSVGGKIKVNQSIITER